MKCRTVETCNFVQRNLLLFLVINALLPCSAQVANVSVSVDASQIVYTPFACALGETCDGGWERRRDGTQAEAITSGPSASDAYIIPQVFLRFRASSILLVTTLDSLATANITLSTPDGRQVTATTNTTIGNIAIGSLDENMETSLVVTYLPQTEQRSTPVRLGIREIILTISGNTSATASFLPSATLPPATQLPTFTPSSTSTSLSPSKLAMEIGIPVGLGLGLTSVAILLFFWRRRMRQRRRPPEEQEAIPEPSMDSVNYSQQPQRTSFWERRRSTAGDQSWF